MPYMEVEKSGHKTATVCSSVHTFTCGSKLLTVAVLWPANKTANGGSFVASFRSLWPMCQQNCKPWQFYGKPLAVLIHTKKCGQNCKRWQFCGHFFQLLYMAVVLKCIWIAFLNLPEGFWQELVLFIFF